MNKNLKKIDKYLININLPDYESDQHRDKLRHQVIDRTERKQTMLGTNRFWKIAALITILISAGAIAATVGLRVYRYRFEGQSRDGTYHFTSEPEIVYAENSKSIVRSSGTSVTVGPNDTLDVEQKIKDLEEIELLRQQDDRELMRVIETEVNGNLHRTFSFKYVLSDGRETTIGEGDPDERKTRSHEQIKKDNAEIELLREKGERELIGVVDTLAKGELHRSCSYKYTLADGRELTVGESDPELPPPAQMLSVEQIDETWRLRKLKDGEYLGYQDNEVQGKTFAFETYVFTLSDGTEVTHAVGDPKGRDKIHLTEADREEFRILKEAGDGEDIGTVEKEIRGRIFSFKRERYILSDGTEYIWSVGKPIGDQ